MTPNSDLREPATPFTSAARVSFVLNVRSGMNPERDVSGWLGRTLAGTGLQPEILVAEQGSQVPELARHAIRQHTQAVIAGGGDGTVSAVAAQLIDTGIPLGVLPLGTLNHFARELRIPLQGKAALRTLLTGRIINVDVGEVNGRHFVNNSSLGLYPWLIAEREYQQRKGYRKWAAFVQATLSVLRRYPFLDVTLAADGRELHYGTPFVFIGNNRYSMEAFRIGTRETLRGGELCLFVAARGRRRDLLKLALRTLLGRLSQACELQALSARNIRIFTPRRRVRVALDGEVCWMETPLDYRIRPGALRVIVPAEETLAA